MTTATRFGLPAHAFRRAAGLLGVILGFTLFGGLAHAQAIDRTNFRDRPIDDHERFRQEIAELRECIHVLKQEKADLDRELVRIAARVTTLETKAQNRSSAAATPPARQPYPSEAVPAQTAFVQDGATIRDSTVTSTQGATGARFHEASGRPALPASSPAPTATSDTFRSTDRAQSALPRPYAPPIEYRPWWADPVLWVFLVCSALVLGGIIMSQFRRHAPRYHPVAYYEEHEGWWAAFCRRLSWSGRHTTPPSPVELPPLPVRSDPDPLSLLDTPKPPAPTATPTSTPVPKECAPATPAKTQASPVTREPAPIPKSGPSISDKPTEPRDDPAPVLAPAKKPSSLTTAPVVEADTSVDLFTWLHDYALEMNLRRLPEPLDPRWGAAVQTIRGNVRERNEDSCIGFRCGPCAVLVVADGMGGLSNGREASQTAVREASTSILTTLSQNSNGPKTGYTILHAAFTRVAKELAAAGAKAAPSASGVGFRTTLIVVLATEKQIAFGYCGDGGLQVLHADGTEDQLLAPHKARGEAANVLAASLGPRPEGTPLFGTYERREGDLLLVGSDGVFDRVPPTFSRAVLRQVILHDGDVATAIARVLGDLAEHHDAAGYVMDDNLTLGALCDSKPPKLGPGFWTNGVSLATTIAEGQS